MASSAQRIGSDLGALLRPSLGVALWALIPLVLDSAGIAERLVWRVSSAAYFAYICGVVFGFAFPQAREAGALRRASRWLSWASLAGQVLLLLGNAAGPSQAWPYLTALLIALLVSALAFARLLMSTR